MKVFCSLLLAVSMAILPLRAIAEVETGTAQALMQETGLWEALTQVPKALTGGIKAGMAGPGSALPATTLARMAQSMDAAFTVERIQTTALDSMRRGLDTPTVEGVRRWHATPLGQRLLAKEKAAGSAVDAAQQMAQGQAELERADDARLQTLVDLVIATKAVDGMAEISITTATAMVRGIAAVSPGGPSLPSDEQLRRLVQSQIEGTREQMQLSMTAGLAATYAEFSTAELQQYLAFLQSPPGARFQELALAAIGAALLESAGEMGRTLANSTSAPGA